MTPRCASRSTHRVSIRRRIRLRNFAGCSATSMRAGAPSSRRATSRPTERRDRPGPRPAERLRPPSRPAAKPMPMTFEPLGRASPVTLVIDLSLTVELGLNPSIEFLDVDDDALMRAIADQVALVACLEPEIHGAPVKLLHG